MFTLKVSNSIHSSPSSAILVSLWFILTSLIVFYRRKTAISRLPFFWEILFITKNYSKYFETFCCFARKNYFLLQRKNDREASLWSIFKLLRWTTGKLDVHYTIDLLCVISRYLLRDIQMSLRVIQSCFVITQRSVRVS